MVRSGIWYSKSGRKTKFVKKIILIFIENSKNMPR